MMHVTRMAILAKTFTLPFVGYSTPSPPSPCYHTDIPSSDSTSKILSLGGYVLLLPWPGRSDSANVNNYSSRAFGILDNRYQTAHSVHTAASTHPPATTLFVENFDTS
jgi:hypothetical protein